MRAALELYTTVGYRATTTPAIASHAGVAEGTIYRHFSGKEHLLNEVFRDVQRWATGQARELEADRTLTPPERLRRLAQRLVATAADDPATIRMLLHCREERYLDAASRDTARAFRETLQGIMAGGKSDGVVRPGPAELWASVWLALVAFAAERVSAREWTPEHPHVALTLDAAWDAIAAR